MYLHRLMCMQVMTSGNSYYSIIKKELDLEASIGLGFCVPVRELYICCMPLHEIRTCLLMIFYTIFNV